MSVPGPMNVPGTPRRTARLAGAAVFLFALVFVLAGPLAADSHDPAVSMAEVRGAMVWVHAEIPADARTAASLGTERFGNGVVIDSEGLVLTIGYLILEAVRAEVAVPGGEIVPARVVGYDHETGFGLLRAARPLGLEPLRLGDSSTLKAGTPVLILSVGGRPVTPGFVFARRAFAGYWEYLLEDAILTAPPHPQFGGAALIGARGHLLGIGSLRINVAAKGAPPQPGNMFVPIDRLKPILEDLIENGRPSTPRRPWLGVITNESAGRVFITRITPGGPAEGAGLKAGDIIVGVAGRRVADMADFLRKVWARGAPGEVIPIDVLHPESGDMAIERYQVHSIDRYDWLKLDRGL